MEKVNNISAIILSAGYSSRMMDFKPLLHIGDMSILEKAICNFKNLGINDIKVVTGFRNAELLPIIDKLGAISIFNPNYDKGMFSSVTAGIKSLGESIEAFFILPVDNPVIKFSTLSEMIYYYKEYNCHILYPKFNGKRGHPPLISIKLKDGILNWSGEGGLRNYLSLFDDIASEIEVVDHGSIIDIDYIEDYEYLLNYYSKSYIPDEEECTSIINKYHVDKDIVIHMKAVKELAQKLAVELNKRGCNLDINLINAAALLHDIGKGSKKHDLVGGFILRKYGYIKVAEIIEKHMNIQKLDDDINEEQIVYLVDKLVKGTKLVSIEERFTSSKMKYKNNREIFENINRKQENAEKIKRKVEYMLSHKIEDTL